jgi:hypothetical protein
MTEMRTRNLRHVKAGMIKFVDGSSLHFDNLRLDSTAASERHGIFVMDDEGETLYVPLSAVLWIRVEEVGQP